MTKYFLFLIHPTVGSNLAQFARHLEENLQQKHRSHGSSHTSPLSWMQWIFRAIRPAPVGSEGCFSAVTVDRCWAVFQPSLHPPALCHGRLAQTFSRSKNWADTRRRRSRKNQECVKQQEAAGACWGTGVSSSPPPPPPSVPRTLREVTRVPTASRCLVASISP